MSILTAQRLAKYYGAQDVFADVTFSLAEGDKVALVGPNGAGKTTLLRIILGFEEPTEGDVTRTRGLRLGYLPQQPTFASDATVLGEMLAVFADLLRQQQGLLALAQEMAQAADPADAMGRYALAETRFEQAGGYEFENRIKRVLTGLGFGEDTYDWPIAHLSGGQVTRAYLAKLLLQEPDLLLLDEPTNYLDLQALEWLESYLQAWKHSLLIVSHDRYFLDRVVNRVWELNHGKLETYRGNYSHYVEQRRDRRQRRLREFKAQQEQIARTEEFIQRYKAGQRSKEARGRLKRLNRLERVAPPPTDHTISLRLSTTLRSGDNVLMSAGAVIGYPVRPEAQANPENGQPHPLFTLPEVLVQRGDRVVLLGPNGCGKTTLLRTVLGQMEPLAGAIRLGASVRIGYLPQTRDWLDYDKTILEQILEYGDLTVEEGRTLLGRFLFSGDEVYKVIGTLSGGEMTRVALAILTMRGANVLLLDEPTTHLDVESQEILQDVLVGFRGTIILVSHDRYLIDALASHLWVMENGQFTVFEGNYTAYSAREVAPTPVPTAVVAAPEPSAADGRGRRREQAEVRKQREQTEALESEIESLEQQLAQTTSLIDLASARHDGLQVQSLGEQYQALEHALAERMRAWEQVAGKHV
jgi:ATP-binding cassette subfamily F protein 3